MPCETFADRAGLADFVHGKLSIMSTRRNNGSHYENHQREAELQNGPAHAYRVAAQQHGKQDHLTDHEQSRQTLELSRTEHHHQPSSRVERGASYEKIAARAYELWQDRGCPDGSPEEDWFYAEQELRSGE
jgi:hypothetical protein